jgi:phosphomannomutase
MIPWLLIIELLSLRGQPLSEMVRQREQAFPCSGELNYRVVDCVDALRRVESHFSTETPIIDRTDGISLEFTHWRFNLRASNTEPLLRLNVESHGDPSLVMAKVREIESLLVSTS